MAKLMHDRESIAELSWTAVLVIKSVVKPDMVSPPI